MHDIKDVTSESNWEEKILQLHQRDPFYHKIDLGFMTTPGKYGHYLAKVMSLMDFLDLKGRRCLDIGCMDGKMSFEMEKRGGLPVAVDQFDRPHLWLCKEILKSKVSYHNDVKLDNIYEKLDQLGYAAFDMILNSGVLYHSISPFRFLIDCRRMLKNNGFMMIETGFVNKDDNAMYFQCDDSAYSPGSFFFLSRGCLLQMITFLAMVPLQMICEKDRIAILCQAVKPSEMPSVNPYQDRHHYQWDELPPGAAECLYPLNMSELEKLPTAPEHRPVPAAISLQSTIEIISPHQQPKDIAQVTNQKNSFMAKVITGIKSRLHG